MNDLSVISVHAETVEKRNEREKIWRRKKRVNFQSEIEFHAVKKLYSARLFIAVVIT